MSKRSPLRPWLSPKFTYQLPARLWRLILDAHDQDEQLAHTALATAFLVAADQVSVPHRPKPAPQPMRPPVCPHCGHQHCELIYPAQPPQASQEAPSATHDAYQVQEGPPHELPAQDPWKGAFGR